MKKLNPIEKSKYINDHYKEYLRSSFQFGNGRLQELFNAQLDKEDLFKGPFVDLNLPFERGKNLNELIDEGIICRSFKQLGNIDFMRPLYFHQEEAIRKIGSGKSAIITTGTGSGKTECFLYPILNELLTDIENGHNEVGIRAIFLYPMNALVNDQIDRVRKILSKCPDIKYGFFTGETNETVSSNYREKYGEENDTFIPPNELVSRKEIRLNPPHLLFTNYSMLEYLLIKPNDYSIFNPDRLRNWNYVVLDEAHSYHGSLGIELSLLMRRLTGLAPKKPRFILTSATLGKQGESENAIIQFAHNLTSTTFESEDIIFSKRIPVKKSEPQLQVLGTDYVNLKENLKNINKVKEICNKYHVNITDNIQDNIYELLYHDNTVYNIYNLLKSGCSTFKNILENLSCNISEAELIALIDLINLAEKNGVGLFDLKYHSFVRPLSGAYITLGKNPQLSLTKKNTIDGLKAFEIGNCRYCCTPFIIGKMQHNSVDGLDYLFQNKEIDIYENYGSNEYVILDYFLMENIINKHDIDPSLIETYIVCSKCGCIHIADNLNSKKCKCGDQYEFTIYKVKQTKDEFNEEAFNNINKCPCCNHRTHSGIVKSLNLGKDEGTAVIAQILFDAIDDDVIDDDDNTNYDNNTDDNKSNKKSKKSLLKSKPTTQLKNVKQFLSFSDGRQQASFASVFFNETNTRVLQKRLIWNVIQKHNFRDITIDELASSLTDLIKREELFSNEISAHKNAWISIMRDLLRIDGSYDGEGLGLYYFDLDLSDIDNDLTEEDVTEVYGQYGITKNDLLTTMKVVFQVFKVTPAINYAISTLTPEEKKEYLGFRQFDNYIVYQNPKQKAKQNKKSSNNFRSLLPVGNNSNMVVRYIQKVFNCDIKCAIEVLDTLFNTLAVQISSNQNSEKLLIKHGIKDAYQINVSKYIIKNHETSKYYRCSKCGRLTPYNVHNVCPQDNCDGTLIEVDPDIVLKNNYYRNQYKTKKIERIIVKEHTAQLDRKQAKKYQLDFKNKKINILSCSTTFEMGIDIGDLETVFMRNVPPTPANYVQRAGRAGRRKDSSAYILTYCDAKSHDYTYFMEPEKMISGTIMPPFFNVLNKKIIKRHLMATCLGFFFRSNPKYFKTIDELVFNNGTAAFKQYVSNHPHDLNSYIGNKVLPENYYAEYHNFKWFDEMGGNDEKLEHLVKTIQGTVIEYKNAKKLAVENENYTDAAYYTNQINNLHQLNVIDVLSKYCVIPKYGFPVDVVELEIYEDGHLVNNYDLSRDLKIAISEYAPDSEGIVDGTKYTSKYISVPKASEFPKHYFCTCHNCKKINVYVSNHILDKCKYCGQEITSQQSEYFIEPIDGFKAGITKESTRMKPKRSYTGEVSYLGGGIKDNIHLEIGKYIIAESSTDDELLIINRSKFYMCPTCGYSEIVKNKTPIPVIAKKHKNYRQYDCENENLVQLRLGHRFQTDVARFTIPTLTSMEKESYSQALSFLYAFLEGVSNSLEIERTDIDGILEWNLDLHSFDILLYDNVPGGAGHVKRLMNRSAVINSLNAALNKVSQSCCDENTSCYNCLRNYYNQAYHERIKRKYAKNFIEFLLREIKEKSSVLL